MSLINDILEVVFREKEEETVVEAVRRNSPDSASEIPGPRSTPEDAPSGLSGKWIKIPELSDEFNGSRLNEAKWEAFNSNWKGRAPGWFNAENVAVRDGCLQLTSRVEDPPKGYPEKFETWSTAFVRSKAQIGYGFVQATVLIADSITSSAFWLVHNERGAWNEIDVFEASNAAGHSRKYHMNMHLFRVGSKNLNKKLSKPKTLQLGFDMTKRSFVAGLERNQNEVVFYVNGKVVRRVKNEHWHEDMWVQFDSETMGNWFGLPKKDDPRLPAVFRIFEVRAWRRG